MLHVLLQAKNKFNFDVTIKDTLGINQNKMKNMDNNKDKRLYKTCEKRTIGPSLRVQYFISIYGVIYENSSIISTVYLMLLMSTITYVNVNTVSGKK